MVFVLGERSAMDTERRRQRRDDAFKTGTLFFAEGRQCADCLVWNLSMFGAMLEVEDETEISNSGRFICERLYADRAYRMIWRDGRKLGIEFED